LTQASIKTPGIVYRLKRPHGLRGIGSNTLSRRASRGALWLTAGSGTEQALRLARNMLLARILAPEAFGVMAIVIAVNAGFQSFTELGIKQAIIQNPQARRREYLNGAWWLALVRGILLYSVAFAGAPLIARFYNNPSLASLLRVAFLGILFSGAVSTKAYVAVKDMDFKRWVSVYHLGGILGISTTVTLALAIRSVWALVIGFAVEAAARCALSYIVCPFKPGFLFKKADFAALLRFAKGMLGLPILTFIFLRTDIFVIGKLCTATELGYYSMAVALAQIPIQFSTIAADIMMPAFSEMQRELDNINRSILQITSAIASLGFPIIVLLSIAGKDLLSLFYGAQYGRAAVPFAIVFATALIRVCSLPIATVYLAIGRPALHRLFVGVRALLIIILILPAVRMFGLVGAATAGLISMMIAYLFQAVQIRKLTRLNLWLYLLLFARAIAFSSIGVAIWLLISRLLPRLPHINLWASALGCLITLGLAYWAFQKSRGESPVFAVNNCGT